MLSWISSIKDIALVVLSGTAIIFGYIQSRKSIRAEWIKGLRLEIAKLNSTASRISVSESDFRRETTESIGLITLYLSDDNKLHNDLMKKVKALEEIWLAQRFGNRKNENILDYVHKVNQSAKKVIKAEAKKIF